LAEEWEGFWRTNSKTKGMNVVKSVKPKWDCEGDGQIVLFGCVKVLCMGGAGKALAFKKENNKPPGKGKCPRKEKGANMEIGGRKKGKLSAKASGQAYLDF